MKKSFLILTTIALMASCKNENVTSSAGPAEGVVVGQYDTYPVYEGTDMDFSYTPEKTTFRVWAPTAEAVTLRFYQKGDGGEALEELQMQASVKGTWTLEVPGDQHGKYYTFQVKHQGQWLAENPGVNARAVGVNGNRAMVVDLDRTDPEGWEQDKRPPLASFADIILYELHVRDLSTHANSGITHKGKFLGMVETGTTSPDGSSTGLDHIRDLGVTHVHILPAFDFRSIDETKLEENKFNWGYDPHNYNVPEGSYSTDPYDGATRVREFKQMVKGFHDAGLRVVMDVVYNHTFVTDESPFSLMVPGYYYRQNPDGSLSNASGCGNETASDREMFRRYMIESVKYWATEYHVDGFRFDLMAIHDIETMNQLAAELHAIDPSIYVYGEGWTAGDSPLPVERRALKHNATRLEGVAVFSDDMRDAIKGHWYEEKGKGFVAGRDSLEESIKFGVVGSTQHPGINYEWVNYSNTAWANQPTQTINYVSCHDNHTLWDKLKFSVEGATDGQLTKMHKLANAIVLTSQGVPFLHAGVEMLRDKRGEHNSYNLPDSINQIDWSWKAKNADVLDYYKGLIALRRAHPAFRMPTQEMIQTHLEFFGIDKNIVCFRLKDNANGDAWKQILVIYNGSEQPKTVQLPESGKWTVVANGDLVDMKGIQTFQGKEYKVAGTSCTVIVDDASLR